MNRFAYVSNIERWVILNRIDRIKKIDRASITQDQLRKSMLNAAKRAHIEVMKYLYSLMGADYDYNPALAAAAITAGLESMELLKSCGATDFDWALEEAARSGRIDNMEVFKSWGASKYNSALAYAAAGGRVKAMELLKDWGATDYNRGLAAAAGADQVWAMFFLKHWGATDYDAALACATRFGRKNAMCLLRSFKRDVFWRGLTRAALGGVVAEMKLLIDVLRSRDSASAKWVKLYSNSESN